MLNNLCHKCFRPVEPAYLGVKLPALCEDCQVEDWIAVGIMGRGLGLGLTGGLSHGPNYAALQEDKECQPVERRNYDRAMFNEDGKLMKA